MERPYTLNVDCRLADLLHILTEAMTRNGDIDSRQGITINERFEHAKDELTRQLIARFGDTPTDEVLVAKLTTFINSELEKFETPTYRKHITKTSHQSSRRDKNDDRC